VLLVDVNVLVYAYRSDTNDHDRYRDWLTSVVNGESSFGYADLVLSGFVRVVTHPRAFVQPDRVEDALAFADALRGAPQAVRVAAGAAHWSIFSRLCRQAGAKGNLVPDAFLAALAIESGCEWVTADRDYARFPDLRWHHPFDA
jgi:uncharacterized protein